MVMVRTTQQATQRQLEHANSRIEALHYLNNTRNSTATVKHRLNTDLPAE